MQSRSPLKRRVFACAILFMLPLSGCGEAGPHLAPVQGNVTLTDGTPIEYEHVILHPDVSRGNTSLEMSQGTIRQGMYTIMTGAREGAPPGKYKVSIEAAKEVDPNNPYFTEWLADEKYVNPDRSGLTMDVVEEGQPGQYDFKLNPHPPQRAR